MVLQIPAPGTRQAMYFNGSKAIKNIQREALMDKVVEGLDSITGPDSKLLFGPKVQDVGPKDQDDQLTR
jgi:hypothetical protein